MVRRVFEKVGVSTGNVSKWMITGCVLVIQDMLGSTVTKVQLLIKEVHRKARLL